MAFGLIPTDWIWGLAGGLMIGAAAALLLLFNGRILGASGILARLTDGSLTRNGSETLPFLAALIGAPALAVALSGGATTQVTGNYALLITGGLLVGFGALMANGCTSGHGVCGMSRFSLRSIVSTVIYLGFGMAAYFVAAYGIGVL